MASVLVPRYSHLPFYGPLSDELGRIDLALDAAAHGSDAERRIAAHALRDAKFSGGKSFRERVDALLGLPHRKDSAEARLLFEQDVRVTGRVILPSAAAIGALMSWLIEAPLPAYFVCAAFSALALALHRIERRKNPLPNHEISTSFASEDRRAAEDLESVLGELRALGIDTSDFEREMRVGMGLPPARVPTADSAAMRAERAKESV